MPEPNPDQERMIKMQKVMQRISKCAFELHGLMEPGTTVTITFPEIETIAIPGRLPKMNRLIIVRPYLHLEVALNRK